MTLWFWNAPGGVRSCVEVGAKPRRTHRFSIFGIRTWGRTKLSGLQENFFFPQHCIKGSDIKKQCTCAVDVCERVCSHGGDSEIALEAYWVSRGSSEELHSQSRDTDKKQSRAAMNPPSVRSLSLSSPSVSLSQSALTVRKLWRWEEMGEVGGGGRNPAGSQSLISRIWVKKEREGGKERIRKTCPSAAACEDQLLF